MGKNMHGKGGEDLIVRVPIGTTVRRVDGQRVLADLIRHGQEALVARGGRWGRGNARFATATHKAPKFAEKGEPGEELWVELELKLLADVGLIGLPNAGKSTLLARVSAAQPKIADYPFTTLEPQLGLVRTFDDRSFVMADLPGLIEGASEGRGRGTDFLRHAERCRVLLHIVDVSGGFAGEVEPWESFLTINREIALYGAGLERLPMLVAMNKADLPAGQERLPEMTEKLEHAGYRIFPISALTGEGVDGIIAAIDAILLEQDEAEAAQPAEEKPMRVTLRTPRREMDVRLVDEGLWEVSGTGIERLLAMTDLQNEEAVARLQRSLERMGLFDILRERGVKEGDRVRIRGIELEFTD
jgi:GTP-binding protein